jgi:DNA-binding NarL/FixJ family response regulator
MAGSERGEVGNTALRVSVVARSPVIEYGIVAMLEWAGFMVVADSGDGFSDSVSYPNSGVNPDVVIVDTVQSDDISGPELRPEHRELPAVFITDAAPVLPPGTRGNQPTAWLRREASREELAAAVRAVAAGLDVYDPGLGGGIEEDISPSLNSDRPGFSPVFPETSVDGLEPLTPREVEVLGAIAGGLTNKAIAFDLGISEHTVKYHVGSILTKLDVSGRTEAVTVAARMGLISL